MEGCPPPADSGTERPYKLHKSIRVFCNEKKLLFLSMVDRTKVTGLIFQQENFE